MRRSRDSGLPPQRLEIEITESVLLERGVENHAFIEQLKGIGIELALDDFGTGYSSLSYLIAFPFDKIKIDKSFIRNLTHQPRSSAIISSIVTLARGARHVGHRRGGRDPRGIRAAEGARRQLRTGLSVRAPGAGRPDRVRRARPALAARRRLSAQQHDPETSWQRFSERIMLGTIP